MKRFHFPLEKVLRWRAVECATEEAKLKRLIQEQLHLQMRAASLMAEKSRLDSMPATLPNLTGDDLRNISAYALRLRMQAQHLGEQRARCERDLSAQKKKYNEAKQRVRLLEELKSRKREQWRYEECRELEALAGESYLAALNRERR